MQQILDNDDVLSKKSVQTYYRMFHTFENHKTVSLHLNLKYLYDYKRVKEDYSQQNYHENLKQ